MYTNYKISQLNSRNRLLADYSRRFLTRRDLGTRSALIGWKWSNDPISNLYQSHSNDVWHEICSLPSRWRYHNSQFRLFLLRSKAGGINPFLNCREFGPGHDHFKINCYCCVRYCCSLKDFNPYTLSGFVHFQPVTVFMTSCLNGHIFNILMTWFAALPTCFVFNKLLKFESTHHTTSHQIFKISMCK